jgi:hypothetical protein
MPPRIDDTIVYREADVDEVLVTGPLGPQDRLKEVCAWVYQESPDGGGDAAATEMTTHLAPQGQDHNAKHFDSDDGQRWLLLLKQVSTAKFRPGRAYALAVALFEDLKDPRKQRSEFWYQSVELLHNSERIEQAHANTKKVLRSGPVASEGLA